MTEVGARAQAYRPLVVRAFFAELRSGVAASGALLTTAVMVTLALTVGAQPMLPGWADPLNVSLIFVFIVGPVAGGLAAVRAALIRRSGLAHVARTGPRGLRAAVRLGGIAVFVGQAGAWGLGTLFLLLRANLDGPATAPMLLLPAAALAAIAALVALGTAAGFAAGHWIVGPLVAVLALVVLLILANLSGQASAFSVIFIWNFYQDVFEPNAALLALHVIFGVALTALVVSLLSSTRPRRLSGALIAGTAVLAATVGLSVVDPSPVQLRTITAAEATCETRATTTLCVMPESADHLDEGLDALVRVRAVFREAAPTPDIYTQEGMTGLYPGSTVFEFDTRAASPEDKIIAATRAMSPAPLCGDDIALDAWFDVTEWLQSHFSSELGSTTPEDMAAVRALSAEEQRMWLDERLSVLAEACR